MGWEAHENIGQAPHDEVSRAAFSAESLESPQEQLLGPIQRVYFDPDNFEPLLDETKTREAFGIKGKLVALVTMGTEDHHSFVGIIDTREVPVREVSHLDGKQVTVRYLGKSKEGHDLLMTGDFVAVMDANVPGRQDDLSIRAITPDKSWEVGRAQGFGTEAMNTVSRDHCEIGINENGIYVQNKEPSNKTWVVAGREKTHRQPPLYRFERAIDPVTGRQHTINRRVR